MEFELSAWAEGKQAGSAAVEIEPLKPAEVREVRIELPTGNDLHYFGRVLAEVGGNPIAGAKVRLIQSNASYRGSSSGGKFHYELEVLAEQQSDRDGLFEFWLASWRNLQIQVEAPGFASVYLQPSEDHETPEKAEPVRVRLQSVLHVRLLESSGAPVHDAAVRVWTEAYNLAQARIGGVFLPDLPDPVWSDETDPSGLCVLETLPPGVPLHAEVIRANLVVRKELTPLTLSAGEVREIEWRLGSGCRLEGTVVDQTGKPVTKSKIWLESSKFDGAVVFQKHGGNEEVEEKQTDEEGRFAFDDVRPGKWWLGPAAERDQDDFPGDEAVAPFAEVVEIPEGVVQMRVDLRVHRGLYIRGRVLDPAGEPVAGTYVWATPQAVLFGSSARTKEDGSFALGPVIPGRYQLVAHGWTHDDSEPADADAGDEDVVLRLRIGGSMRGVILDAETRKACAGELVFGLRDEGRVTMTSSNGDGSFKIEGLPPGEYYFVARSGGQRVGVLPIVAVQRGVETGDLVVELRPGATIHLRYVGIRPWMHWRISAGGTVLASDGLRSGETIEVSVPPGRHSVVWSSEGKEIGAREVEVRAGESTDVVLSEGD